MNNNIVVGLDLGTAKVVAIVASKNEDGTLSILGIGVTKSEGLNRGVVVNIEKTVQTIKNVIEQAEIQSGIKIEEVVVGIAGDHIESFQSHTIITTQNPESEITDADLDRLIEESKRINIPNDRQIIHIIPQEYVIDGQDGITNPVGMSGVRLDAKVNIVTGLKTAINNIYRCVERCGLKVKDIVLEPIACSYSVLENDEKEVGVALVDIGGGTTDIAIIDDGILKFTSIFAIAGKHVTNDIRQILGIIETQAERIKKEYGHCYQYSILKDEEFMVPGVGGRKPHEISKGYLCSIIQPRMEELFEFALSEIERSGLRNKIGAGIVLTGGATLLKGTEDLAKEVFGMPIKIGMPTKISVSGLAPEVESPVYATAVGLLHYGFEVCYKNMTSDNKHFVLNEDSTVLTESMENNGNTFTDVIVETETKVEYDTIVETEVELEANSNNEVKEDVKVEEKKTRFSIFQKAKEFIEHL